MTWNEAAVRGVAHCRAAAHNADLLGYTTLMTCGSAVFVERTALPPPGFSAVILRHRTLPDSEGGGHRYCVPMPRSSPMRSAALSPKPVNTTTVT